MHNTSTIYRFYTPFLDIEKEKKNLWAVGKKIEKSLTFDWVWFNKTTEKLDSYFKITLNFDSNLWKIDFYYINQLEEDKYFMPIFKCDIYLNNKFLQSNLTKKKWVWFLNNIFECFDWLTEKEYLIDLNNSFYYKKWFFGSKKYPDYDFLNLEFVQKQFESKNWIRILENFILHLQKWDFILTKDNSSKYHKFYGTLLYFLYLVYLMDLNIKKTSHTLKELEKLDEDLENNAHIAMMKKRLSYVDDLTVVNYKKYREKLEIFFNLLK